MHFLINLFKEYRTLFLLIFSYASIQCLSLLDSNQDEIIGNVSLYHLKRYLVYLLGFFAVIILSTKSKYSIIKNSAFSVFILVFLWFFLEFVCLVIYKLKIVDFDGPKNTLLFIDKNLAENLRKPFWGDFNKNFGKWRLPNDSLNKYRCDDNSSIHYKTNIFGARDKLRSLNNATKNKRVIFLGDSFVEGVMVNTENRCSDILENTTKNEHLNFGINGTSPINYYLIYKTLAKKFEHDIVIIGVLPANDFEDYADGDEADLVRSPIYRPYWKNTSNGFVLKYSLASLSQAFGSLAIYDRPQEIFQTRDSVYQSLTLSKKIKSDFLANSYLLRLLGEIGKTKAEEKYNQTSFFENYPKNKWPIFSYSLKKLIEEAKGKEVIVVTIPTLKDIQLSKKNPHNSLSKRMEEFCNANQVNYIDMLPEFNKVNNPIDLYVECDGHWNEKGEKYAAEVLLRHPIYRKALTFK